MGLRRGTFSGWVLWWFTDLDVERDDWREWNYTEVATRHAQLVVVPSLAVQPGCGDEFEFWRVDLLQREVSVVDRTDEPSVVCTVCVHHRQMSNECAHVRILAHLHRGRELNSHHMQPLYKVAFVEKMVLRGTASFLTHAWEATTRRASREKLRFP